jgi:hypothetical protein
VELIAPGGVMSIGRFYLNNKGDLVFVCPFCGEHHEETLKEFENRNDKTNVDCTCGNTYQVQVELRKHYRKKTNLRGRFKKLAPPEISGAMLVTDLSFTGCAIETAMPHRLAVGDKIGLTFTLDDEKRRTIKKEAIVQSLDGRHVGCRFVILPSTFDPDLGYYLRSL